MALIKCKECEKEFSDTAEVCPHCGYSEKKEQEKSCLKPPMERKSKYKAAVLTFFFFPAAAGDWYLGNYVTAIIWAIICVILGALGLQWSMFLCYIALFRTLLLLCMNQEKFDYTYNRIKK